MDDVNGFMATNGIPSGAKRKKALLPNSKKAQILTLLEQGVPIVEITSIVGTTVGYVLKVQSENKEAIEHDRGSSTAEQDAARQIQPVSPSTPPQQALATIREARIPSSSEELGREERMEVWKAFHEGKTPADLVIAYGRPYEVYEREYQKYLRAKNINIREVESDLIERIAELMCDLEPLPKYHEEFNKIVADFRSKGYLTSEQHRRLLDIFAVGNSWNVKYRILDAQESLPDFTGRPLCAVCGKPLDYVLVATSEEIGQEVLEFLKKKGSRHANCKS